MEKFFLVHPLKKDYINYKAFYGAFSKIAIGSFLFCLKITEIIMIFMEQFLKLELEVDAF